MQIGVLFEQHTSK